MPRRKSRAKRARKKSPYDAAWRKARNAHIQKNAVCWACDKPWCKGFNVHHTIGVRRDPTHEQLTTLCPSCHSVVTLICARAGHLKRKHLDRIWKLTRLYLTK